MARIRTIKPEIGLHEGLFDLEAETGLPIRFTWAVLPCHCDREGRFPWRPRPLGAQILPYDDIDFSRVLDALTTRGFLVRYRVDDAWFGWIPTFRKHQIVNGKEKNSELPGIDQAVEVMDNRKDKEKQLYRNASTTRAPRVNNACATPSIKEGKGKEGKGTDIQHTLSSSAKTAEPDAPAEQGQQDFSLDEPQPNDHATRQLVEAVFADWQQILNHPQAKLGPKRYGPIKAALDMGYTRDQLADAFVGCSRSAHHMGLNARATRYDSLELILRSETNIDRFRGYRHTPPKSEWRNGENPGPGLARQAKEFWEDACRQAATEQQEQPALESGGFIDHDSQQYFAIAGGAR